MRHWAAPCGTARCLEGAHHDTLVPGAAHNRGEDGAGGVVTGKAGLHLHHHKRPAQGKCLGIAGSTLAAASRGGAESQASSSPLVLTMPEPLSHTMADTSPSSAATGDCKATQGLNAA